ncbi:RidA family protein [Lacibacter luteus]|uniref:RidA family protein n=2 Tax=Lacibacter luteus TaxID=2508719 RepID=A0A4V1M7J2_9BACT|nr:RidA family protein [Lacibacter luteus]
MCIVLSLTTIAQQTKAPIEKEKWHWGNPNKQDTASGYAQTLKVGDVLYISGTVSTTLDEAGVKRLYSGLERSLKQYGLTFQHVVKENLYTTDIEAMKQLNDVRKQFYKGDFPAATWVQITRLFMPEAKLEVELVAHFPKQ